MAEACTTLAVADHHQSRKAEALASLHGLGDAVDMNQLLDQLLTAFILIVAAIITTAATATVTATTATIATPATTSTTLPLGRSSSLDSFRRAGCLVFDLICHLELQSGFARGISKRLDATVEKETAAIEHDFGNAGLARLLSNALADLSRRIPRGAVLALHALIDGRGGSDRTPGFVVNDLRIDVTT
jgi:hypothetical protein